MPQILNSKGEPITLTPREQKIADYNKQIANALGADIDTTTLTAVQKKVVEQKFFTVTPSEFFPVAVGNGAFMQELLTFRSYATGGDFEAGIINTAAGNSRLAEVDAAVDSVSVKIKNWAKEIKWSIFDLEQALKAGNWDLISSKEKSRKKNWDLGIQKIAFLGSDTDSAVKGLLTQADVVSDTATITKYISAMSTSELDGFVKAIYEAYRSNSSRTAEPTIFVMPETDYNGLGNFPDSTYPLKNRFNIVLEAFKHYTNNPNFQIKKLAYADQAVNADGINLNRYALYNYDEDSIRMDIPVDYTGTVASTINGFQYQNVGYGQFTGVKAYRPKEVLYFDWSA